jgi:hypothetical protein
MGVKQIAARAARIRFAEAFFKDPSNAGKAYMSVFPDVKKESAWAQGSRWVKDPIVKQRLAELEENAKQVAQEKLNIDTERILQEEARIAFLDPRQLYDENGRLLPPNMLPEDVARALDAVKVTEVPQPVGPPKYKYEYKFNSKGSALDRLEGITGMKKEGVPQGNTFNLTQIIVEIDGNERGKLPSEIE